MLAVAAVALVFAAADVAEAEVPAFVVELLAPVAVGAAALDLHTAAVGSWTPTGRQMF